MASTLCPYCSKYSHMTIRWGRVSDNASVVHATLECDNCERLVVALGEGADLMGSVSHSESNDHARVLMALTKIGDDRLSWLPTAAETPEVEDVPVSIARAAKEAYRSAAVGNHMAAILMARTVIEATAKEKGIKNGVLASKINAMRDADLIRPAIAAQAHEVRFAGNDMAHGDIDVAPAPIDSEEILALMASVLTEVFQDPARLERIRARRAGA
ncbi:DUF4145 domain-containing protein [Curtobacterium flaccumfaciens pv. flaccumfaciens]|uniref:DUF4145 domain-containing protein n=1 Tax=Curtobacterium flaccumfaciens TaxID=2035 RepID=UPI003A4D5C39